MAKKVNIALIDKAKDKLSNLISATKDRLEDCSYIDLRVRITEGQGAVAQDGMMKSSIRDYSLSYGLRVIAGRQMLAAGYFGQTLGAADVDNLPEVVQGGLHQAYERAIASSRIKSERKSRWEILGQSLHSTELAPIKVCQDTIPGVYRINPIDVSLGEVTRLTQEVSKAVSSYDPRVKMNQILIETSLIRELFVSSEGANIDRTYALTQGLCAVVAVGNNGIQQSHYDCLGHQRGWEILTNGIEEELIRSKPFMHFALDLAADSVSLSEAKPCPSSGKEVVVVTDPHYNALLVHEIIGHPTELDRALKLETAYAGRSWFLRNLKENMLGKQVASPLVSAYSDPLLQGYGHYEYDDEGTPAKRAMHIDKGIFCGFMNSRQTAAILGVSPNGHSKATDASLVPLIRMSTTVFGNGERDPEGIVSEVDHGYYLVSHRIPSISESRENFRITARKVFEIKNGRLGEMFRDGGIMANTKDYLMSVDAVGNDLRIWSIFNCGKGQPMQAKKLGNGGPTMRSYARLVGGKG
jgi:TldD protein